MKKEQFNLLPLILEKRAKDFVRYRSISSSNIDSIEQKVRQLESLLNQYQMWLPFFAKVDAWKAYYKENHYDLWLLERIGWAKWKRGYGFLYVLEGLSIPKLENADVITVNSSSPPFLPAAHELNWSDQILAEETQVAPLLEIPNAVKEKVYPYLEEFLFHLSATLRQMEELDDEFSQYLDQKIEEYLSRIGTHDGDSDHRAIQKYFRIDRRVELFHEFLEDWEIIPGE